MAILTDGVTNSYPLFTDKDAGMAKCGKPKRETGEPK